MSLIQEVFARLHNRSGLDELPRHLESKYGIRVDKLHKLDSGVFRVDRHGGPPLVARVFPASRATEQVVGDAAILDFLEQQGFPAERLAGAARPSVHPDQQALFDATVVDALLPDYTGALSSLDGQSVLVTSFVEGKTLTSSSKTTFRRIGDLLGRLHSLPAPAGPAARMGGALHLWCMDGGGLRDELDEAAKWLVDSSDMVPAKSRPAYDELLEQIASFDVGDDLPQALNHPDLVSKNVIATEAGELVPIDWGGAGQAARAVFLGFLLIGAASKNHWKPDAPQVDAVLDGYSSHVTLERDELARMGQAMPIRALIFSMAMFALGSAPFDKMAEELAKITDVSKAVAARALAAFEPR